MRQLSLPRGRSLLIEDGWCSSRHGERQDGISYTEPRSGLETWVSGMVLSAQDHCPVLRLSRVGAFDGVDAFTAESLAMARERDDGGMETGGYWQG